MQVGVYVERKAVHRYKPCAFHTDGANFSFSRQSFVNPYACGPIHAFSCYAVVGYCAYHRFFEQIDVVFHSEMMALQVDDGICYKLPRTVERYVASALYPDKLDSFRGKGVLGYKHVFRMPVSAECEDWRMLHEQKMFLRVFAVFVGDDVGLDRLLQFPRFAVGHES